MRRRGLEPLHLLRRQDLNLVRLPLRHLRFSQARYCSLLVKIVRMNPRLDALHPYPFECGPCWLWPARRRTACPINLSIGEPKHAAPERVAQAIRDGMAGLSVYPSTKGDPALRRAISARLARRYSIPAPDAENPGAARAGLARSVVRLHPDGDRSLGRRGGGLAPTRSTRSTKARRCWPAAHPITSMPTRRAISAATGTRCRKTSGARRGWCSSARQATRPAT